MGIFSNPEKKAEAGLIKKSIWAETLKQLGFSKESICTVCNTKDLHIGYQSTREGSGFEIIDCDLSLITLYEYLTYFVYCGHCGAILRAFTVKKPTKDEGSIYKVFE